MIFAVANAGYSIIDAYNNPEKTLETEEDTWNLKLPDMEKAGIIPRITRFNQLASRERLDNEPFNVMADINGPFTTTQLCGMEKYFLWTVTKPDIARHLLRLATDQ